MRRILAGLALALLVASPVLAAPPIPSSASLSVTAIVLNDPSASVDAHGRIDFQSDPYQGKPGTLILIWQCYADWLPGYPTESDTPSIDKQDGTASIWFRNGIQESTGTPYCQNWEAWVALESDWTTPISPVLTGTL